MRRQLRPALCGVPRRYVDVFVAVVAVMHDAVWAWVVGLFQPQGAQHAVYVSVDWVKYGPDKDPSVTRSGSVPDLSIDPHAWFADNETSTELASPSRCHSKSAFAADSFLGKRHRRRSTGHALHGGSPQAMTPASADPRLNHRRSFSADYVDDGASGSTAQDAASAGGSEVPAPRTPARAASSGGAASASPGGAATLVRNLSSDEPRRTRTRGSSGDGSTRRRRRGGIRRRQSFSQDGSGTAATPPRPSVNVRVPRADIKRVSVNGKVRLRKSDSLLDRAVTARGMLGLAVVAAVLSSVDAFCQYFLRPSLCVSWCVALLACSHVDGVWGAMAGMTLGPSGSSSLVAGGTRCCRCTSHRAKLLSGSSS